MGHYSFSNWTWSNHTLSQPFKLILINTIVMASILHHLAMFHIPLHIAHKIKGMIDRFFWGTSESTGIHWRSKHILQMPKGMGGLGIRNIGNFDQALLMKQVRCMQQHPQLLVSRVFKDPKQQGFRIYTRRHNASWGSRGLQAAETTLIQGLAWKVG